MPFSEITALADTGYTDWMSHMEVLRQRDEYGYNPEETLAVTVNFLIWFLTRVTPDRNEIMRILSDTPLGQEFARDFQAMQELIRSNEALFILLERCLLAGEFDIDSFLDDDERTLVVRSLDDFFRLRDGFEPPAGPTRDTALALDEDGDLVSVTDQGIHDRLDEEAIRPQLVDEADKRRLAQNSEEVGVVLTWLENSGLSTLKSVFQDLIERQHNVTEPKPPEPGKDEYFQISLLDPNTDGGILTFTDDETGKKIVVYGHASDNGIFVADTGDAATNALIIFFELLRFMAVDPKLVDQFYQKAKAHIDSCDPKDTASLSKLSLGDLATSLQTESEKFAHTDHLRPADLLANLNEYEADAVRQAAFAQAGESEFYARLQSDRKNAYPEMERIETAVSHLPGDRPWNGNDFGEVFEPGKGGLRVQLYVVARRKQNVVISSERRIAGYALLRLDAKRGTVLRLQVDPEEDFATVVGEILKEVRAVCIENDRRDLVVLVNEHGIAKEGALGNLLQKTYKFRARGRVLHGAYEHAGESADAYQLVLWLDDWPMEIEDEYFVAKFSERPSERTPNKPYPSVIKLRELRDQSTILAIEELVEPSVGEERWSLVDFQEYVGGGWHVALRDMNSGEIIGYAFVTVSTTSDGSGGSWRDAEIMRFRVHPDYRNSDAADMLMDEVAKLAAGRLNANNLVAFVNEAERLAEETSDWQLLLERKQFEEEEGTIEEIGMAQYYRWTRRVKGGSTPLGPERETTLSTVVTADGRRIGPIHLGNPREVHDPLDNRIDMWHRKRGGALKLKEGDRYGREIQLVDNFFRLNGLSIFGKQFEDLINEDTEKEHILHPATKIPQISMLQTGEGKPILTLRVGDLKGNPSLYSMLRNEYKLEDDDEIRVLGHASDWGLSIADSGDPEENARRIIFELLRFMGIRRGTVEAVYDSLDSEGGLDNRLSQRVITALDEQIPDSITTRHEPGEEGGIVHIRKSDLLAALGDREATLEFRSPRSGELLAHMAATNEEHLGMLKRPSAIVPGGKTIIHEDLIPTKRMAEELRAAIEASELKDVEIVSMDEAIERARDPRNIVLLRPEDIRAHPEFEGAQRIVMERYNFLYLEAALGLARAIHRQDPASVGLFYTRLTSRTYPYPGDIIQALLQRRLSLDVLLPRIEIPATDYLELQREALRFLKSA